MRPASRTFRAAAVTLALWLASGVPFAVQAQTRALPSNLVATLSLDGLQPTPPRVATPSSTATAPPPPTHLRSGFVPPECRAEQTLDSPLLVDCWLRHVPRVAAAIRWEFVGKDGPQVRAWPEWDEDSRRGVREAFQSARRWYAGGMKSWTGPMAPEPPENREAPHLNDDSVVTVLDGATTWSLFTAQVGLSLAAELGGWMPWSLRGYATDALEDLFDAPRRMFTYDRDTEDDVNTVFPGYSPRGAVTPSHPATTFRFLRDNRLLGATPVDTIAAVLEWSRRHMRLAFRLVDAREDDLPRPRHLAYWHYEGKAPLVRILGGTRLNHPKWGPKSPETEHWTSGCAMTTDALTWILRAANIPTRRASLGTATRATCGHMTPFFSAEGLYLSHGDDPYDPMSQTASFTTEALLVRAPMWRAWFPEGPGEPWCWNVGRRVVDLNVRFPSEHLVRLYCEDTLKATPREEGLVLLAFRSLYQLGDLERHGLWDDLATRATKSTAESCVRLRGGR